MKKLFIILLLSLTLTANAVELQTIQIKPTLWEKITICKWHISCYFSKNLGTTLTTITGTETVSYALKTTTNNNFTALNNGKIEVSTTTLPLITTLAGLTTAASLSTVGTITTGVWNASTLTVSKGGTGSTTLSAYQVLLGNGTSGITVPSGWGTTGQFLTSNGAGAYPSWQSASVNQGIPYTWTAQHTFSSLFATIASTTNATTTNLTVTGNVIFSGTMTGVANVASTSVWTSSGTWTKPAGAKKVFVQMWGGGGSGQNSAATAGAGGGGGGEYRETWLDSADLTATVVVTVGAGGAAVTTTNNGIAGAETTFGSYASAGAGGEGYNNTNNGFGGESGSLMGTVAIFWGKGAVTAAVGGSGIYSAGGGYAANGGTAYAGGNSYYGGAGGGGAANAGGDGGTSTKGGNGGAGAYNNNATAGSVPGGGGGANSGTGNSGAGGNGKMIITTFF